MTKTSFALTTHEREWRNLVSGVIVVHSINKTGFRQKTNLVLMVIRQVKLADAQHLLRTLFFRKSSLTTVCYSATEPDSKGQLVTVSQNVNILQIVRFGGFLKKCLQRQYIGGNWSEASKYWCNTRRIKMLAAPRLFG